MQIDESPDLLEKTGRCDCITQILFVRLAGTGVNLEDEKVISSHSASKDR
jgi:hypothetical protein